MEPIPIGEYLVIDPRVCHGQMTFKGTRVPVETVLAALVLLGDTIDQAMQSWPRVKREAIEEAIRLAMVAWPELLRPEAEERLRRLAATLAKKDAARRKTPHEPAHSGRTA